MLSLTKCRECKKTIPKRSKFCPHCNTKWPVARLENILTPVGILLAVFVINAMSQQDGSKVDKQQAETAAAEPEKLELSAEEQACRADIDCWGRKHVLYANTKCIDHMIHEAPNDYDFTTGFGKDLFKRWQWSNQEEGYIIYYGDELKLEDQYGKWWRVNYACEYGTLTGSLLSLNYAPGRLQ